jgi:hypothetical protein
VSDPNNQQDQTRLAIITAAVTVILVGLYTDQVLSLLHRFARVITKLGVRNPVLWGRLRSEAASTASALQAEMPAAVDRVLRQAVEDASAAAEGTPFRTGFTPFGDFETHSDRAVRAIRDDLVRKLDGLGFGITRFADDVYRAVTADAAVAQVTGVTPAAAQGDAYRRLVSKGVTGFTDSAGRNWELSAYVEMATRTATQRAYNTAHLDRMQQMGFDLFTVTDDGHPCPLCQPWQGQILSVVADPRADATIADATAAGLFHPNCRHTLLAYDPRSSIPAPRPWTDEDATAYWRSQQQRKLERDIRAAKREQAAAFTPDQRVAANRDLRRAQARMRDFISQTGRVRNTRREQLNLGA